MPGSQHGFYPASVRAYARGDRVLARRDGALVDQDGARWAVAEDALRAGGVSLARLGGEAAYWFAWRAFHPDTELRVP